MKPLSELVTELRVRQTECGKDLEEPLAALAHYCWKEAADELQAWLREADLASKYQEADCSRWIRTEILGTTRTEGKK